MKISKERKKELQEQYKLLKPDMGIFAVINKSNGKYYLEPTENLKGVMNSTQFKLDLGSHREKELQKDWQGLGKEKFEIKILEQLEYDQDESKTDYTEELTLLKMLWIEKLTREGVKFY